MTEFKDFKKKDNDNEWDASIELAHCNTKLEKAEAKLNEIRLFCLALDENAEQRAMGRQIIELIDRDSNTKPVLYRAKLAECQKENAMREDALIALLGSEDTAKEYERVKAKLKEAVDELGAVIGAMKRWNEKLTKIERDMRIKDLQKIEQKLRDAP